MNCRRGREKFEAWRRRSHAEHHHGHEGPHEDQGEEQTRDLRAHQGCVHDQQNTPWPADEDHQTERSGRDLQMVG